MAAALGALLVVGCAAAPDGEDDNATTNDDNELKCVSANANKLALIASKMDGKRSGGYCYRYVKAHLRGAGFPTASVEGKGYGVSAYKFAVWAKQYPAELSKMGLKKINLGLDQLPKGAVIVWPRGMCGYHKEHGHIEVVVDEKSSRACSDFCGRIKKDCGTPDIFVPKSCTGEKPTEADGEDDDSVKAPATDPGDDAEEKDNEAEEEGGGCWSPTLSAQVPALECVQSKSDRVWFQCKDGQWFRGVKGDKGPFAACSKKHGL